MSVMVLVAYTGSDPNGAALGTLTDARDKTLTVEDNAVGSGSFAIHPGSAQIGWATQGNYIRVRKDTAGGALLGGCWLEEGGDTIVSPQEEGGKEWRRGGRGPIAILRKGEVWHRSVLSDTSAIPQPGRGRWLWKSAFPARVLIRLLDEAQARGTIAAVTRDFTKAKDSSGTAWTRGTKGRFEIPIGKSLLEVVGMIREADMVVAMTPDLVLRMWEGPHDNDLSATIGFTEGVNIRASSDREVQARRAASHALVGGEDREGRMRYRVAKDATIQTALGERIEAFVPYERSAELSVLRRVGRRRLRRWKKQHDGPLTLGVIDTAGKVALVDYTAGDTVEVHIPGAYTNQDERIVSVTLKETENGEYDPILRFGDLGHDPITGADMGGEAGSAGVGGGGSGGGGGGGSGGGPSPGGGTSTGGGSGPGGGGGAAANTDEYQVEDWTGASSTEPSELSRQTTVTLGTSHVIALPPGVDLAGRHLLLAYTSTDADAGAALLAQFTALGFTSLQDYQSVGSNSGALLSQVLDGTQGYDAEGSTLVVTTPASDTIIAVAALVEGVSTWQATEAVGDDPPSVSGWAGENELAYVFGLDDAAISGTPSPFTIIETQNSGGAAIRVGRAVMVGAFNPGQWTMTGTAQFCFTVAGRFTDPGWGNTLRGQGVDNEAPWDGGNAWATVTNQGAGTFTTTATTGLITITADDSQLTASLESDSLDDPSDEPWGPWADADGTMRCRWKVNRLGVLTDAFSNIVEWEVEGPDYQATFRVHLGDNVARSYMTTQARGLVVLQGATPTASAFIDKTLVADTFYHVRMDFRGTRARFRIWATTVNEPVAWDIDVAKVADTAVGEVGRWHMRVFGGITGSQLVVTYDTLWGAMGAASGSSRTQLPRGDGTTTTWVVGTFAAGSLRVWVDGLLVRPASEDPEAGTFTFGRAPALGAWIEAEWSDT